MTDIELAAKIREITGQDDNFLAFVRSQYDRMAMKDMEGTWSVYIQINMDNYVTAIDSSAFIPDPTNWLKVDEGEGEFYKYCRVLYCPKGLTTDGGYNYKLVDGVVVYAPQIEQPTDHNEMSSQEQFFLATRNYSAGELISIQGRMYEATAMIPDGCKIVPGQNAEETTQEAHIIRYSATTSMPRC